MAEDFFGWQAWTYTGTMVCARLCQVGVTLPWPGDLILGAGGLKCRAAISSPHPPLTVFNPPHQLAEADCLM